MDFTETISENKSLNALMGTSVFLIPRLLRTKPSDDPFIGKAWREKSQNGRVYYKLKFDCFLRRNGKSFYAKGWSRKEEADSYDIFIPEKPAAARYPLLLNKEGFLCFIGKPAEDGSIDLMLDHRFMFAD